MDIEWQEFLILAAVILGWLFIARKFRRKD